MSQSQNTKMVAPFVMLLLSGIFIIISSSYISFLMYYTMPYYGWMGGMMQGWYGMHYQYAFPGIVYWVGISGIIMGLIVIISSVMVYRNSRESLGWGIIALIASSLSLLSMGGFIVGAILGIIGSALAITYSFPETKTEQTAKATI